MFYGDIITILHYFEADFGGVNSFVILDDSRRKTFHIVPPINDHFPSDSP